MTIEDWASWLEEKYRDSEYQDVGICEVGYFTKESRNAWFTKLYYSFSTGWSQVLFYSESPQTETVVLRIDYYPTALEAICDNSILPPGLMLYMR